MQWLFVVTLWVFLVVPVQAFSPVTNQAEVPYEVFTIDAEPTVQREYLGLLNDYPHMYELSSDEPFTLRVELWREYLDLDQNTSILDENFSLIVVRQNEQRGVSEVARWRQAESGMEVFSDARLAIDLRRSEPIELEVQPGTYRIEVSSPNNVGPYALLIGQDSKAGVFETLGGIRAIQAHFGYSWFTFLRSSYVFYPLGIVVLLALGYATWRYRQRLDHVV